MSSDRRPLDQSPFGESPTGAHQASDARPPSESGETWQGAPSAWVGEGASMPRNGGADGSGDRRTQQGDQWSGSYPASQMSGSIAWQPGTPTTWSQVPPAPASSGRFAPRATPDATGAGGATDDLWADNADLMAVSKSEYEQIARELDEIRMLIKQSSSELEKLNQRKVLAAAKTREMEEKIETFSRQEIRASYLASSEAEMRAFMIAEQREQLQAKEKAFERYQHFLMRTIDVLASLASGTAGGVAPGGAPLWGVPPIQAAQPPAPSKDQAVATLSRVIQAQEDVRQRVAQRLHDGPAQSLANVVLTAEICEKLIQSDPRRAQGELGNLKGLVNSTLQDARKFIFELRPMTLDDLGLVPTLRRYIADVGARYQVQVTLVAPQGEQRLPHHMEVPIFRVAQEALLNAVQHGRATQARVTVALQPDAALLVVEDNGAGFDVEHALAKAAERETLGIASMQERAEMLGGWLRIESARGHGSRVELSVPIPATPAGSSR